MQSVSDLINRENMIFYKFEQFQEKVQTNNFIKYYGLISKIPNTMKKCLKENCLNQDLDKSNTGDTFLKKTGVM